MWTAIVVFTLRLVDIGSTDQVISPLLPFLYHECLIHMGSMGISLVALMPLNLFGFIICQAKIIKSAIWVRKNCLVIALNCFGGTQSQSSRLEQCTC